MQIPTDLEHAVVKQKRGERLIRRIGMTMRYVKIVLQSGRCRTAKRSIAHCRSKKWSSGWGPQGCSKSPSNFPIVRERVLRDARKLPKGWRGLPPRKLRISCECETLILVHCWCTLACKWDESVQLLACQVIQNK